MTTRILLLTLLVAAELSAAGLRAAAVKVDITPSAPAWLLGYRERQSTGVHDKIYHRVVVLDDGAQTFALVSTEVCLVSPAYYDDTAKELERATGISRNNFWWTVTHTHAAPELGPHGLMKGMMPERATRAPDAEYAARAQRLLIDAVKEARAKLAPARFAVAASSASANINRRARDPRGNISLGLNPDGPVDRQLGVIRLTGADGKLIAVLANYSMHGTVLGQENVLISGDGPGVVSDYVEKKLGAPMLYINGAAGNLAPIYTVTPSFAASHITEFNVLLGDRILSTLEGMGPGVDNVTLAAAETHVETPLRDGFKWDESMSAYRRVTADGQSLVRVPVRRMQIGEAMLWAAPLELFCEISMNVRMHSTAPYTFYFGYTNGWFGYLATKAAHAEGGYEVRVTSSPFTDRAERDFTSGVIGFLRGNAMERKTP